MAITSKKASTPVPGPSNVALGKRKQSPSFERQEHAAKQAIKRNTLKSKSAPARRMSTRANISRAGSSRELADEEISSAESSDLKSGSPSANGSPSSSSVWSDNPSVGNAFYGTKPPVSVARTHVVPNRIKNATGDLDSSTEDSNIKANTAARSNEAHRGSTSASTANVSGPEADIALLKAQLELVSKLRAQEMDAARKLQVRLYMFAGQVQGLYDESIRLADSMLLKDI